MVLQFQTSLQKLDVLFRFSGMNLQNTVITSKDVLKYRWLYIFNSLWVFSALVASVYFIIAGLTQAKSFIELTSVAPCFTFSILAILKSLFHLIHEKHVQELTNILRHLDDKENERIKSEDREVIITTVTNFLNGVINILYVLNCSMIVVFDMTPLILIAVKYYRTNEFEMLLPYLDVFTFVPYEFKYWPFAFIHQVWSECVVLLYMGAADYLFFTCTTYIEVQFKLLKYDFENIISTDTEVENEMLKTKFTDLVTRHQSVIQCTNILEIIYSKSTLFNFLSSSLVICLTGFNVTIVNDIVVVITFLTFLFMGLMQVFFLCFFADKMMRASMEVSDAIYNSVWFSGNHDISKELLFVQTRAQKPCKLTGGGFTDVNLTAFMRVLSSAWSYFALLHTLYNGNG